MTVKAVPSLLWILNLGFHLGDVLIYGPSPDLFLLLSRRVTTSVQQCLLQLLLDIFLSVNRSLPIDLIEELSLAAYKDLLGCGNPSIITSVPARRTW